MATATSQSGSAEFSRKPMTLGKAVVLLGLTLIAVTSFFTPSGELKEWVRIAGFALILIGGLAYGFGRLVRSNNEAPRANGSKPVA